jgi:hypothetical protein
MNCEYSSTYAQLSTKVKKLEKSNKELKCKKRASMIPTVIAMTLAPPESMGMVVLGNPCIVVRNLNAVNTYPSPMKTTKHKKSNKF